MALSSQVRTWVQSSSHSLTRLALDVCLPRLAIHLTASAVQYLHTLRAYHSPSTSTRRPSPSPDDAALDSILEADGPPLSPRASDPEVSPSPKPTKTITLSFTAPTMGLQLHDDLQHRALVDVAVGGLNGHVTSQGPVVTVGLQVRHIPQGPHLENLELCTSVSRAQMRLHLPEVITPPLLSCLFLAPGGQHVGDGPARLRRRVLQAAARRPATHTRPRGPRRPAAGGRGGGGPTRVLQARVRTRSRVRHRGTPHTADPTPPQDAYGWRAFISCA